MNQQERFNQAADKIMTSFLDKRVAGVEIGTVPSHVSGRKEMLLGGDQEFITLLFTDGSRLRVESRSGGKGDGGFLVLR